MSRMTTLCGNFHWAGLTGRPGACAHFDRRRSRRRFLIWDGRSAGRTDKRLSKPAGAWLRMIRSWSKQVAFSIGSGGGPGTGRGEGAVIERSREADAFLPAIDQTAPVTAFHDPATEP